MKRKRDRNPWLECTSCGAGADFDIAMVECPACGGSIVVRPSDPEGVVLATARVAPGTGIWRFGRITPVAVGEPVTLGEGDTPVVHLSNAGREVGHRHLYAKLESLNPTGSFKDRGSAALASALRAAGRREGVIDSSGNAGVSLAAYAAKAGLKVRVYVPAEAPPAKVAPIAAFGARMVPITGGRARVEEAAVRYVRSHGVCYASANHHPLVLEGMKTYGYELIEAFAGDLPEHLVFPVGNGILLSGVWLALKEFEGLGRIGRLPKIHCIQAAACDPITAAFERGLDELPAAEAGPSIADGLLLKRPPRGRQTLAIVRAAAGQVVSVADRAIARSQRLLARADGVYAEPSAAAALAGALALIERRVIGTNERVLIAITGHGLKTAARQATAKRP